MPTAQRQMQLRAGSPQFAQMLRIGACEEFMGARIIGCNKVEQGVSREFKRHGACL
jgi:hypothetical protein